MKEFRKFPNFGVHIQCQISIIPVKQTLYKPINVNIPPDPSKTDVRSDTKYSSDAQPEPLSPSFRQTYSKAEPCHDQWPPLLYLHINH